MNVLPKCSKFLWLAIFAILSVFVGGRWGIPAAAWLAPIFGIRFFRDCKNGWYAVFWLWLAAAASGAIASHHTTILYFRGILLEPTLIAVMTLPLVIPYVVDRLFQRRWVGNGYGSFWLTLVFPISFTAIDFASAIGSPLGSFGALAYSQAGATTLMQITSITGMAGLTFIISWFASVANYAWESRFQFSRIKGPVTLFAAVLVAVSGFGIGRLGGFSLPLQDTASMHALFQRGADDAYREAFKGLNRWQLEQVRSMSQQGARIVVLQEVAVQGLEEELTAILADAANLAREEGIYLALPTALIVPDGKDHNAVRIIGPDGNVVLEHLKFGGAFMEGSLPGSGELQFVDTPFGRLSAAICWDADFPDVIIQAGEQNVDLLLLPSNDWFGIRNMHPEMATFRAVENGMPIFRQTGNGVSSVIDAYGRVINRVDMFEGDPRQWGGLQMVDVPIGSANTLYTKIGDVVGWAAVIAFLSLLGFALIRRRHTEREESITHSKT